jgi:hypothetical protein
VSPLISVVIVIILFIIIIIIIIILDILSSVYIDNRNRDNSVGIARGYGLDGPALIPSRARLFTSP